MSIRKKTFVSHWKIGKLILLFKGKGLAKMDPASYRPISLLSVTSKLVERAVQVQLLSFMDRTRQLNLNNHTYHHHHSTTTALLQMMDNIYAATDENMVTVLMTIDESCAFDCVNFNLLLEKMRLYNFAEDTVSWFQDYLTSRSNYVTINTKDSRMTPVRRGVPQGSVLVPLLYTLLLMICQISFNNDSSCTRRKNTKSEHLFGQNCPNCGSIPSYTDNATVLVSSKTRHENQSKLENHLININI